jgi:cyclohexadieny/prephenate dehydrogenase
MTATSKTTTTPEQTVIYEKITIIGVGLIGASTALAARRGKLAGHITACDADPDAVETSRKLGFADEVVADPQQAVIDADLVIMAVPVGAMGALAASIVPAMKPGAVLTDSGSTKRSVLRDVDPVISDDIHWLPSHPLAGTEHSGPAAGHAHLFDGRYWILVPRDVPDDVVVRFESFLTGLGSVTERMDADYHDKVLALTSHLPHLIAYTIVSTAVDLETQLKNDVIRFSASGFRDFTRIAASDPVMWRDVFVNNDEAVLEMLQRFSEDLSYLQRAIRWGEKDKLETLFTRTREIRRSIIDAGQD